MGGVLPALADNEDELTLILPVFKGEVTLKPRTVPFVTADAPDTEITLYFDDAAPDLPFISVNVIPDLMAGRFRASNFKDYDLKLEQDGDTVFLSREENPSVKGGNLSMLDLKTCE